jgi:predicted DNA-binding antitoxin AbrB/MazE fold protein
MSTSVEAIYENGVFRPLQHVDLAEGTRVEVIVITRESPPR